MQYQEKKRISISFIGPITWANVFVIVVYGFFELIESYVNHVDKINQAADAEGCINNW